MTHPLHRDFFFSFFFCIAWLCEEERFRLYIFRLNSNICIEEEKIKIT